MMADPQILHDEQAFRQHVFTALGEIKAGNGHIVDRLDKLNGSVARHEADLNELKTAEAVRKAVGESKAKWWEAAKPFVYAFIMLLVALVLMNGPSLVKGGIGGGH